MLSSIFRDLTTRTGISSILETVRSVEAERLISHNSGFPSLISFSALEQIPPENYCMILVKQKSDHYEPP